MEESWGQFMGSEEIIELSAEEKTQLEWIKGPYFGAVHGLLDSNRAYLNQGITWSIGILTAVLIFGFTYIAPLQEIKNSDGEATGRALSAIAENITDGDILLLTAVLGLSTAFIANFLSRSMKGFLNLMRYVSLYSACVRLASGTVPVSRAALASIRENIRQYDDEFCPPLTFWTVVWKMATELGYGLFFGVLLLAHVLAVLAWLELGTNPCSAYFWLLLALGPVWLAAELILLRRSSYYRYGNYEKTSWHEAERRK